MEILSLTVIEDQIRLNRSLVGTTPELYTGNTSYTLSVSFSEDWVSRTVLAVFIKGSTAYQVNVGVVADAGEVIRNVLIPSEILTDADNAISFGFYSVMEGTSRLSTELGTFSVVDGAYRDGTTPAPPAPDIWEQLVQKAVPMIDPTTTNWMIWDMTLGKYVDTGFPSRGEKGDSGSGINNILDGAGSGALQQIFDGGSTLDFTGKNPALTADNVSTYFGAGADISKLPKGGVGNFATSLGGKSVAKGKRSTAEGTTTVAIGAYSHAEGDNSVALGDDSHAEGYVTLAEGAASHSEGGDTHARGPHSHTEGGSTLTSDTADYSHAEGLKSEAHGNYSHAEGHTTTAEGSAAHSEGSETQATGDSAHSEGYKTNALGNFAHSEGGNTIASAESSHAEGASTEATSVRSHAEGSNTKTGALVDLTDTSEPDTPTPGGGSSSGGSSSGSGSSGGTTEVTITKGASHSEGYRTSAYGWGSHSEGGSTVAYHHYTHAEGVRSNTYGEGSHAEGECTETGDKTDLTKGLAAHSEGSYSKATGKYAHAEGRETVASGEGAHAEGKQTTASGLYAHAQGKNTTASGNYSFAVGDNCAASGASSFAGGNNSRAIGENSFAFGYNSVANAENSVALAGGQTDASKKFAVGDYLWVDNIDNLHTKGEVNRLCHIDKSEEGWYKFATLDFHQYTGGSMLLNVKQSYVGEKYNVLIELAATTMDNGFHEEDGFIFRQIAGKNICDKVGYYKDDLNCIHFIIKKGTYEKISMVALSNNFEGYLNFYNNFTTSAPPSIVYLDDSLLPPAKAEVQAMINSAITTLNTEV